MLAHGFQTREVAQRCWNGASQPIVTVQVAARGSKPFTLCRAQRQHLDIMSPAAPPPLCGSQARQAAHRICKFDRLPNVAGMVPVSPGLLKCRSLREGANLLRHDMCTKARAPRHYLPAAPPPLCGSQARQAAHRICRFDRLPNVAGMVPLSHLSTRTLYDRRRVSAAQYRAAHTVSPTGRLASLVRVTPPDRGACLLSLHPASRGRALRGGLRTGLSPVH